MWEPFVTGKIMVTKSIADAKNSNSTDETWKMSLHIFFHCDLYAGVSCWLTEHPQEKATFTIENAKHQPNCCHISS